MQLLVCLIEARGAVVDKDEIVARVWNGNRIADSALTRGVSELRRALGDDAGAPLYIETIPRRGYRLVARSRACRQTQLRPPKRFHRAAAAIAAVLALLAVTVAFRAREPAADFWEEAPPLAPARLMQLSTAPGIEAFPDHSPDGSSVVYSGLEGGRLELFVQQLVPGGSRLQLTDDGQQNVQPAWSPDGRSIAYHSISRGGIWVMPALGGEARRVSDFGSAPAWLASSRALVFQSAALVELTYTGRPAMAPSRLWRVDLDAGDVRPLTDQDVPPGGHGTPTVSPRGDRVLFSVSGATSGGLYSVDTEGRDLRAMVGAPRVDPEFSPDGRFVYSVGSHLGELWLWRTRVSPEGEALAPAERVLRGDFRWADFDPSGDRLIASDIDQTSNVYALGLDARGLPLEEERALTRGTNHRDINPMISPDGALVAYRHRRVGQLDQLWLVRIDGSENTQLTLDPNVAAHYPSWSQDGEEIFFQSFRGTSKSLFRFDLQTRQAVPWLELPPEWGSVRVSRDGTLLVFHQNVQMESEGGPEIGVSNVHLASTADLEPRRVTDASTFAGFGLLSRDGTSLAYEVEGDGTFQLVHHDLRSGEVRQLTAEGQNWPGAFSSRGAVAFTAQRDGLWNLYSVDPESGEEVQLTTNSSAGVYYRNPDLSTDDRTVVFERGSVAGDLWEIRLEG